MEGVARWRSEGRLPDRVKAWPRPRGRKSDLRELRPAHALDLEAMPGGTGLERLRAPGLRTPVQGYHRYARGGRRPAPLEMMVRILRGSGTGESRGKPVAGTPLGMDQAYLAADSRPEQLAGRFGHERPREVTTLPRVAAHLPQPGQLPSGLHLIDNHPEPRREAVRDHLRGWYQPHRNCCRARRPGTRSSSR